MQQFAFNVERKDLKFYIKFKNIDFKIYYTLKKKYDRIDAFNKIYDCLIIKKRFYLQVIPNCLQNSF